MSLLDRLRGRDRDETLRLEELEPRGGSWSGRLFDNPSIGLAPELTWTFAFDFAEIERDVGTTRVSLAVDWVPLPGATWSTMAGRRGSWRRFGEPVECSASFFEHFRYDAVKLRVLEQDSARLRVAAAARKDLDGLGIRSWRAEDWLEFRGISVQLTAVATVEEAQRRLAEVTDLTGLVPVGKAHRVRFVPATDRAGGGPS